MRGMTRCPRTSGHFLDFPELPEHEQSQPQGWSLKLSIWKATQPLPGLPTTFWNRTVSTLNIKIINFQLSIWTTTQPFPGLPRTPGADHFFLEASWNTSIPVQHMSPYSRHHHPLNYSLSQVLSITNASRYLASPSAQHSRANAFVNVGTWHSMNLDPGKEARAKGLSTWYRLYAAQSQRLFWLDSSNLLFLIGGLQLKRRNPNNSWTQDSQLSGFLLCGFDRCFMATSHESKARGVKVRASNRRIMA